MFILFPFKNPFFGWFRAVPEPVCVTSGHAMIWLGTKFIIRLIINHICNPIIRATRRIFNEVFSRATLPIFCVWPIFFFQFCCQSRDFFVLLKRKKHNTLVVAADVAHYEVVVVLLFEFHLSPSDNGWNTEIVMGIGLVK